MALFLLGSAPSACAQDMAQLIACRAVQGLGAGALEGLSFILVADLFAGRRSAALQGLLAGLMALSFIAGPRVGGFFAHHAGWRWAFLFNLPIGLAAIAVVATILPRSVGRSEQGAARLDVAGIALLTGAVGLLLVGLSEHSRAAGDGALLAWTEPRTGGLIAAGVLLLWAFVAVERRVRRRSCRCGCSPTGAPRRSSSPARRAPSACSPPWSCCRATSPGRHPRQRKSTVRRPARHPSRCR
jgi:MFS family permease